MHGLKSAVFVAWLSLAGLAVASLPSQSFAQENDVAVAVMVQAEKGISRADAIKSLKKVDDYLKKQPGYVSSIILGSKFEGNDPDLVHLTRWDKASSWEALFNSPEFLELIKQEAQYVSIKPAEVFERIE